MSDKVKTAVLEADAAEMAAVVASTPPEQKAILRAVTKAVILGAQIAERCTSDTATDTCDTATDTRDSA